MDFLGIKDKNLNLSDLEKSGHPVDKILVEALNKSNGRKDSCAERHEHQYDHSGHEHWRDSGPAGP